MLVHHQLHILKIDSSGQEITNSHLILNNHVT